jgi:hypothetical protein
MIGGVVVREGACGDGHRHVHQGRYAKQNRPETATRAGGLQCRKPHPDGLAQPLRIVVIVGPGDIRISGVST